MSSAAATNDIAMDGTSDYGQTAAASELEERWVEYQSKVGTIYRDIRNGDLDAARRDLLAASNWLLSQIVELGKSGCSWAPRWPFSCSFLRRFSPLSSFPLVSPLHVSDTTLAGLHLDNAELWTSRIKVWDNFNNAWLSLLQRQLDMVASGSELQRGQSLISHDDLEKMGGDLIRVCDSIERHGLVDFHYGVWEEQITARRCRVGDDRLGGPC
jgi:hypothetical protein